MADRCFIQSLTLQGFRAYLEPQTFDLKSKRSLAIFAPNGYGKSGVIDALEFLVSEDGTLDRLGKSRSVNSNQAGYTALSNDLAQSKNITPIVKCSLITGNESIECSREASGTERTLVPAEARFITRLEISPIIRGYKLREFVEHQTPQARYNDVVKWLQLSPLLEIQENIHSLRKKVKAKATSTEKITALNDMLGNETSQEIQQWNENEILDYVNNKILTPLDSKLKFAKLADNDKAYAEMKNRQQAEEHQVGLTTLSLARDAAAALWHHDRRDVKESGEFGGTIHEFNNSVVALANAKKREAKEREKAKDVAFRLIWKEAENIFSEDAGAPEQCPVCDTEIGQTAAGSAKAIRSHMKKHLAELQTYDTAKNALDSAGQVAKNTYTKLVSQLRTLISLLDDSSDKDSKFKLVSYRSDMESKIDMENFVLTQPIQSSEVTEAITNLIINLDARIKIITDKQGDHTWGTAMTRVNTLLDLQNKIGKAKRTSAELAKLNAALNIQAGFISGKIRDEVQSKLDILQNPMNEIYKEIQGEEASPIRLELPKETDSQQQRLHLRFDFSDTCRDVQPSGYLSDSQIHSVALALHLATIKELNKEVPIVALDDIVTSYDADHRRAIATMIVNVFADHQIILATHDERFFQYLKDQLGDSNWQYKRILRKEPEYGPLFDDHKETDEMIESRWSQSESAANEMRRAEEGWLLALARDLRVKVEIRKPERANSYDKGELASAIGAVLKKIPGFLDKVPGVKNRFLESLKLGEVENFGSHFQDAQYGAGSIGDEKVRWREFTYFRKQFTCKHCGGDRFAQSMNRTNLMCAKRGCEKEFSFEKP